MKLDSSVAGVGINAYKQNLGDLKESGSKKEEKSVEEQIKDSAYAVTLSMNAQIVLFSMNAADMTKGSSLIQSGLSGRGDVLDFLSGNKTDSGMSLANIGYHGKPITKLSVNEANDLLGENGFFGVKQTSDRVANFVFNFAGDDIELLKKGREGVVKGFEEALKMFGGELPAISYQTQERTLSLIDDRINALTQ
ncbi:hydrogenase-4 component G [Arcobacter sp. FWKO B]|uniref:hydrogenase-4 component G n=1 Tax=Arcobacter sp. FWKO B TaxID=2593672 RepID=UPI0018A60F45|nr:hydrogenase-4 component G [Arcobacter sp. FWKO B]QOG12741.1 hypothetical protein FWKOB_08560 [Arcobacter sp. FWKO B]